MSKKVYGRKYIWYFRDYPEDKVKFLSNTFNISPIVSKVLLARGLDQVEQIVRFVKIKLGNLYDPFLMKDMDKAVERIEKAIERGEKIMIFGDYDVDGTTATAFLLQTIGLFYDNVIYYIPDRYKEGYGVSKLGIDYAKEQGVGLIISVDCGIKAFDEIEYARRLGIDFIVIDHHNPDPILPPAVAVLDPKRKDDNYPFKELSGCGVAFKFMQALSKRGYLEKKEVYKFLDLVALSIAADIVPAIDENRILLYWGLRVINLAPTQGVAALKKVAGLEGKELEIGHLIFGLAPRLNAAGRIEHGSLAVELLSTTDKQRAEELAEHINKLNRIRQDLQDEIVDEILSMIENDEKRINSKTTVVYSPNWHKGVVGIAASKVIETYYKPTIVLTESDGKITGSARSVADYDLYSAIEHCKEYLINFGGHKHAAGLTLKKENLEPFMECFEQVVSKTITIDQRYPSLKIDDIVSISDLNFKLLSHLKKLEPYGPGNPKPVFAILDKLKVRYIKSFGRNDKHYVMWLEDQYGFEIKAIGFNSPWFYTLEKGCFIDGIAFTIEENTYQGKKELQLEIKDFIPSKESCNDFEEAF